MLINKKKNFTNNLVTKNSTLNLSKNKNKKNSTLKMNN
jgi:hypothetical protein